MMSAKLNIYQTAREARGLTQETAAELLDVSVQTLSAYERDCRRPPDCIVRCMAEIYAAPHLAIQHLRTGELAEFLPDVRPCGLQEAAIRTYRLMAQFTKAERTATLLDLAEDGSIDADEQPVYAQIMQEMAGIAGCYFSLYLQNGVKKEPPTYGHMSAALWVR